VLAGKVVQLLLECSELGGLAVGRIDGWWIEDVVNRRGGNWVIEVFVFVVPLHTKVMLAGVLKRLVNWLQVLGASH